MPKAKILPFISVEIEINHDCNRVCSYCPNSISKRKTQGRMSKQLFLKILEELRILEYEGKVSYHFYNEPLLSPDLEHFVSLTRQYLPSCRIEIYTNGTLLSEERLLLLLNSGVDKFTVTQHHPTQRNEPYLFEKLYNSLAKEIQAKIKFQNYRNLVLTSRGGMLKNVGYSKLKPPIKLSCLIPSLLLVITVNGNVLPCYEDYNEQNVMGNMGCQTLSEIWNTSKYVQFRNDLKLGNRMNHPVCKDCNCILICP